MELEPHLWERHRAELYGFVARRVGDAAAAEDIVQDVLLKAYAHRDGLARHERLRAWLYRIARNAVIDHYRTRRPAEPLPPDLARDEGEDEVAAELARCIRPLLAGLPASYREALLLSELEGLTQRETARRLGLSLSGAKSRVQRGRRMLEALLLDCCRIERDSRGGLLAYEEKAPCGPC